MNVSNSLLLQNLSLTVTLLSTYNRFEMNVPISLLLQNLPLLQPIQRVCYSKRPTGRQAKYYSQPSQAISFRIQRNPPVSEIEDSIWQRKENSWDFVDYMSWWSFSRRFPFIHVNFSQFFVCLAIWETVVELVQTGGDLALSMSLEAVQVWGSAIWILAFGFHGYHTATLAIKTKASFLEIALILLWRRSMLRACNKMVSWTIIISYLQKLEYRLTNLLLSTTVVNSSLGQVLFSN